MFGVYVVYVLVDLVEWGDFVEVVGVLFVDGEEVVVVVVVDCGVW